MSIPWWMWLIAGLVGLVLLFRFARNSWRAQLRRELREVVAQEPGLELVREEATHLELKDPTGAVAVLNLLPLYARLAELKRPTLEDRRAIYRRALEALREGARLMKGELSLERDGERILPRLATPELAAAQAGPLVERPVGEGLDLRVVYVLDAPSCVLYLSPDHLEQLGLGPDALHERALANLKARTPPLRQAIEANSVSVLKLQDTFDAARLLLLPAELRAGEQVAAVVPDRDTLAIAPLPRDGDWSGLRKLAETPAGPPLYRLPLRVTAEGFFNPTG